MLPLPVVQEARRLLDEGEISHRKIALQLGVSRGTIAAIASGRRGLYGRAPDKDHPELPCLELSPVRCHACGARVYMPCVLCRAREYRKRQKLLMHPQTFSRPSHSTLRVA